MNSDTVQHLDGSKQITSAVAAQIQQDCYCITKYSTEFICHALILNGKFVFRSFCEAQRIRVCEK